MNRRISHFQNEPVVFDSSSEVKRGVECDVYFFQDDESKDLGLVFVQQGFRTPVQEVMKGERTLQIFKEGRGDLYVIDLAGKFTKYTFPGEIHQVEVKVGEIMQWHAIEDLVFYEICYPPYEEGRFKNIE